MTHSRAYIFDLDGTLVDSLMDISNAVNAGLVMLGKDPAPTHHVQSWVGDGLPTLCRRALPNAPDDVLETLIEHVKTHYHQHCTEFTKPYPKVLQMLNLLKHSGCPLAVLSNKPHALTVQVVESLGLQNRFVRVRGYRNEHEKKPSPLVALDIARELGSPPDSIRFVGDSTVDIETARNAGMIAVAVTWGFQAARDLKAAKPDFLVNDPEEIPGL